MMLVNFVSGGWIATDITIGSGSVFHIHMIASSRTANIDNFYFAGEALILTDGIKFKNFDNTVGFIMKSKINSPEKTCFNLPSGYSIDITAAGTCCFGAASILNYIT